MMRLIELKDTFVGKVLAVFVSILLATSLINVAAFATGQEENSTTPYQESIDDRGTGAESADVSSANAAQEVSETAQPAAQEPAAQPAVEEPTSSEPAAETEPSAEEPQNNATSNNEQGGAPASGDSQAATPAAQEQDKDQSAQAAPADATVKLKLDNASLVIKSDDNKKVASDKTSVKVDAQKKLEFKAVAADGYTLDTVKAQSNGAQIQLTEKADDTYVVDAANVADGLEIDVTTEVVKDEEATEEESATEEGSEGATEEGAEEDATESDSEEATEGEEATEEEPTPEEELTNEVTDAMAAASNGISTLGISGQKQVAIGETIRLSSDSPASSGGWRPKTYTHKWTASPSNAVSFSNTINSGADVTGNRAGTVTINHEWGYDGWFGWQKEGSETYTITVYQADEEDLCTITFDTNGGNWNNSLNGTHKFVMGHELWPEGQDLSVPTRNGYVFEGWTPAVSRVVSDDATYTAQWKQVESNLTPVYVYLQVNGDTSGLILNYSGWYTIGVIYMPSNLVANTDIHQD